MCSIWKHVKKAKIMFYNVIKGSLITHVYSFMNKIVSFFVSIYFDLSSDNKESSRCFEIKYKSCIFA